MLWKRARTDVTSTGVAAQVELAGPQTPLPAVPRDTSQEDHAIDTVVSMLRTLGKLPLGLGDTNPAESGRRFELWANHLAIGGPHPDDVAAAG